MSTVSMVSYVYALSLPECVKKPLTFHPKKGLDFLLKIASEHEYLEFNSSKSLRFSRSSVSSCRGSASMCQNSVGKHGSSGTLTGWSGGTTCGDAPGDVASGHFESLFLLGFHYWFNPNATGEYFSWRHLPKCCKCCYEHAAKMQASIGNLS